uniref:Interleukin n=1 Tax=Malurus cyaneus samueli TaxID=2593467 RepID=A0A8C5TQW5_9PASS
MKRMIICCMLFFYFIVVLTASSPKAVKYKQMQRTIRDLETIVKDKDAELLHTPENPVEGCLYTAVTCFKKEIEKLQPVSNQENTMFTKAIRRAFPVIPINCMHHCESTCESYEKKTPKEFLKSFANLMQMVSRVDSSWVLF